MIDSRLAAMYRKVSGGKREGPDTDRVPRPIGTALGPDGHERQVYLSQPAIHLPNNKAAYVTFENTQPPVNGFWDFQP